MEIMAKTHRVIAPDLRGIGQTARPDGDYDLRTLAADLTGLLDALEIGSVMVAGIDLGVAIGWMLAMTEPRRVRRLAIGEGVIGRLAGAEAFFAAGPPWWFGFHALPNLAEMVLEGNEAAYIDWFLRSGTIDGRGVAPEIRAAFVKAYIGREALRGGFEYYRAFAVNAEQARDVVAASRLTVPTLALIGGVVGEAIYHQLAPITDDLSRVTISDAKHLLPLEQPLAVADALLSFDQRTGD
jgi:pimeloyl-ACP methyl ester carboxylesterase